MSNSSLGGTQDRSSAGRAVILARVSADIEEAGGGIVAQACGNIREDAHTHGHGVKRKGGAARRGGFPFTFTRDCPAFPFNVTRDCAAFPFNLTRDNSVDGPMALSQAYRDSLPAGGA